MFNPFATLVKFQGHNWCQSQIIKLEPKATLKKMVFWSNPYKIEVMITSLIEVLK